MNDDLDRVITSIENLETKQKYGEKNRLHLLIVHGLIGLGAGGCLLFDGLPVTFLEVLTQPSSVFMMGLTPLMGGLLLLLGVFLGRNLILEAVGMAFLLIWDCWMVYVIGWTTQNVPDTVYYPLWVYGGLAAFMCIHLMTLYKFIDGNNSGHR